MAAISPWISSAEQVSPDGRYRAVIADASEIAMGAPTSGVLVIAENRDGGRVVARVESCNPSFVWSDDSRALACPQWTPSRQQRLCIVAVPSGHVRVADGEFRVLELHAFQQGTVRGIDSPVHMPRGLDVSVDGLIDRTLP